MVTKQIFVRKYFNMRANPYGDFGSAIYDILPLEDVAKDVKDLHEIMIADESVYAYETYEVWTTEHNGVEMKSEPTNFSPKHVFAQQLRQIKDIRVLDRVENGQEIYVSAEKVLNGVVPEDYFINVDGGGGSSIIPRYEKNGVEVYNGRSREKLKSFPSLKKS
jgi:hypothetical protein